MNTPKSFDILVPKEYETTQDGQVVKKTAWNRVGRAWPSKSHDSLRFELFLIPNQTYLIQFKEKEKEEKTETVPF